MKKNLKCDVYLADLNSLKGSPLIPLKALPKTAAGSLAIIGAAWSRKLEFSTGGSGRDGTAGAAADDG